MKTLAIILLIICTSTLSFSQETVTKHFKNEIGVDLTPLVKQFLNFNSATYYTPNPYYLMYRRHINEWAIRAGIGGSYWTEENVPNDTTVRNHTISAFDFRLGIERKTDVAKNWQLFYGLDIWTNITYNQNDYQYQNAGQLVGYDNKTTKYGVAPLLGLRFKLNDRLTLTTETNFQLYTYNTVSKRLYIPDDSLNTKTTNKGMVTVFNAPTSLFITFDL